MPNPSSTSILSRKRRFPYRWITRARSPRRIRPMRTAGLSPPSRTAHCTMRTETNTPTCSGRARTTPTTTSPRASASPERTRRIFSAKNWPRSALPRASTTSSSCTGCRKCRITRTTLFRSSPRRTQMPPSWTLTRHRTACSAYSWRGSRWAGRRPLSRRHSHRLSATASLSLNGAAAR